MAVKTYVRRSLVFRDDATTFTPETYAAVRLAG